jgi:RNA polymerase sigma-70 factor (ECF subfamily)
VIDATPDPLDRLSALVRGHRRELAAVARHEGLGPEDALEAVQDALATFVGRPAGDPTHDLASIKVMVRNAARNTRRRHRLRKPHVPVDDDHDALDAATVEDLVGHAEDVVRLRACVAELCGVQRAVVLLRFLEERSGEDVAAALDLTRGHVDVLVHRAKLALRSCMRAPRAHPGRTRT